MKDTELQLNSSQIASFHRVHSYCISQRYASHCNPESNVRPVRQWNYSTVRYWSSCDTRIRDANLRNQLNFILTNEYIAPHTWHTTFFPIISQYTTLHRNDPSAATMRCLRRIALGQRLFRRVIMQRDCRCRGWRFANYIQQAHFSSHVLSAVLLPPVVFSGLLITLWVWKCNDLIP